jgi:hypothetical protein
MEELVRAGVFKSNRACVQAILRAVLKTRRLTCVKASLCADVLAFLALRSCACEWLRLCVIDLRRGSVEACLQADVLACRRAYVQA